MFENKQLTLQMDLTNCKAGLKCFSLRCKNGERVSWSSTSKTGYFL